MQRDLVERARLGDHDAFAALAGAAIERLDTAARLILRDGELARDVVQDALVRAWISLRGLRDPDRFDAWLYRLLVRSCQDELRRRRRRVVELELTIAGEPTVSDTARDTADRDEMERAFRQLDADQRLVLVLHYYLDLPLPEVARLARIPLGTAKSRLHRGLADMRISLAPGREPGVLAEEVSA